MRGTVIRRGSALFVCALLVNLGCGRDYEWVRGDGWYRGNLHTHTLWSDGDDFPESVLGWYRDAGYDFVAVSDHNTLAEGDRWVRVDHSRSRRRAFDQYLERFGDGWVDSRSRGDTLEVRLKTFQEYSRLFDQPDSFLVIQSEEISDTFVGKPLHVNATNIRNVIAPQGGSGVTDVLQRNIDAVLEQQRSTGWKMLPHVAHPNLGFAVTADDMIPLEGVLFFEVYNGYRWALNDGDSGRPSTESIWDTVNLARVTAGHPLLFGLAVDDAHLYQQETVGDPGRGWVMVRANRLTSYALLVALERGDFYATSGVLLDELEFNGSTLEIEIRQEDGVSYETTFVGARRGADGMAEVGVLGVVHGTSPAYRLASDVMFVRATIVSDRTRSIPFRGEEYERAWTQPVMPAS